jgi:hypothetical protein
MWRHQGRVFGDAPCLRMPAERCRHRIEIGGGNPVECDWAKSMSARETTFSSAGSYARALHTLAAATLALGQRSAIVILVTACARETAPSPISDTTEAGRSFDDGGRADTGEADEPPLDGFQAMIAHYRSWSSATSEPVAVSSSIFALCRAPTPFEQAFATSEHGNHRLIREWDNDLALASMGDAGTYPFAPGAAIVKEKLLRSDGGPVMVALGLMIKRWSGFDAAHGDWDFAYWEQGSGLLSGAVQSAHCGDCHAAARGTDFVFADSLIPSR